jgi:hypothetical protein
MKLNVFALMAATAAVACIPAAADSFVETFDGPPVGGWTFLANSETVEDSGGNPGAYLHAWDMNTYFPTCISNPLLDSLFVGNYREAMVNGIGVDVIVIDIDYPETDAYPLTLALVNDSGTPTYPYDDWGAYSLGPHIPYEGAGWASYDFEIPYDATELPEGWIYKRYGNEAPPEPDWNVLMTDVSYVAFPFGDPDSYYIYQLWDVGIDNPRISWVPEPVSLGLLALGVPLLRRRRR